MESAIPSTDTLTLKVRVYLNFAITVLVDVPAPRWCKATRTLQWRHNGRHITSLTIVYSTVYSGRRRSKKTSKRRVTGFCVGNSPVTGELPAQMASKAENFSIWWRHHKAQRLSEKLEVFCSKLNSWWRYGTNFALPDCHCPIVKGIHRHSPEKISAVGAFLLVNHHSIITHFITLDKDTLKWIFICGLLIHYVLSIHNTEKVNFGA